MGCPKKIRVGYLNAGATLRALQIRHGAKITAVKQLQGSHSEREHVDKQIDDVKEQIAEVKEHVDKQIGEVKEHVDTQFDELKLLMGQGFPDAKRRRHE